ncbi:hypothetical protein [Deinococcus sp. UYEF24]
MPETLNSTEASLRMRSILKKVDLAQALDLSSVLSWHDVVSESNADQNPLFPLVTAPTMQYVTQNILLNEATQSGRARLTPAGVQQVLELGHAMLNVDAQLDAPIEGMSLSELTTDLFAPMMRHQARLDSDLYQWDVAQAWRLLADLPRSHSTTLQQRLGNMYLDIPAEFRSRLGLEVEEILTIAMVLAGHYASIAQARMAMLPRQGQPVELLTQFFANIQRTTVGPIGVRFTEADLQRALKDNTPERARRWLSAFSATPTRLRQRMEDTRRYFAGEQAFQLLPLEATPVVRLRDGEYIVPNGHSLYVGFAQLAHLQATLNWDSPTLDRFRNTMGTVQELYLEEFSQKTLGDRATVIPEKRYRRLITKNIVQGPDLTILEHGTRSAVLVESKAVQFDDWARAGTGVEPFATIDRRFSEVIEKADWKTDDLLNPEVGTYAPFRTLLDQVSPDRVVTVVVHAEHMHAFNITWKTMRRAAGHPLHGHRPNFIALSLGEFMRFLEASRQSGQDLYSLLTAQIEVIEQQDFGFDPSVLENISVSLKQATQSSEMEAFIAETRKYFKAD